MAKPKRELKKSTGLAAAFDPQLGGIVTIPKNSQVYLYRGNAGTGALAFANYRIWNVAGSSDKITVHFVYGSGYVTTVDVNVGQSVDGVGYEIFITSGGQNQTCYYQFIK